MNAHLMIIGPGAGRAQTGRCAWKDYRPDADGICSGQSGGTLPMQWGPATVPDHSLSAREPL